MRKWWKRKVEEVEEEQLEEFYEAVGHRKPQPQRPNPGIPERRPKSGTYGRNFEFRQCSNCAVAHSDPSQCHPNSCQCGRCGARRRGKPAPAPAAKPAPKQVITMTVPYEDREKYKIGDTVVTNGELYRITHAQVEGATPWGAFKCELVPPFAPKNVEGALKSLVDILKETD